MGFGGCDQIGVHMCVFVEFYIHCDGGGVLGMTSQSILTGAFVNESAQYTFILSGCELRATDSGHSGARRGFSDASSSPVDE